jgi:hypothetical protein
MLFALSLWGIVCRLIHFRNKAVMYKCVKYRGLNTFQMHGILPLPKMENTIVFVRVSAFNRLVSRPNRLDATDVFVRRQISGMSHGLTNTALALLPFTTEAEG